MRLAGKDRTGFSIPWGDVFTAGISTGIGNVTVYSMVPGLPVFMAPLIRPFTGLLKNAGVQSFLRNRIDSGSAGPDEKTRNSDRSYVYARAWNSANESEFAEVEIETMEGYRFTVESSIKVLEKLEKAKGLSGFLTPSMAFGSDLVLELPDTKILRQLPN